MTNQLSGAESTCEHAEFVARNLRADDVREMQAVRGPQIDLAMTLKSSLYYPGIHTTIIAKVNDVNEPCAMCGCIPIPTGPSRGFIWMVATDRLIEHHAVEFVGHCRGIINQIQEQDDFPILVTLADARNVTHLRWLDWCGFKRVGRHIVGTDKHPFIEFVR